MIEIIQKRKYDLAVKFPKNKIAKLVELISDTRIPNSVKQRVRRRIIRGDQLMVIVWQMTEDLRLTISLNEKLKRDYFFLFQEIYQILEYYNRISIGFVRCFIDNFDFMNFYSNDDIVSAGKMLKEDIFKERNNLKDVLEYEMRSKHKKLFLTYCGSVDNLRRNMQRHQKYVHRYNALVEDINRDYILLCESVVPSVLMEVV
ncbi:MAG: hypothetical protein ACERIH_11380 [Labilibaculum antarcticum]